MGTFYKLDARRLAQDTLTIVSDRRDLCVIYRRAAGQSGETKIGVFWARIANLGRSSTGLESYVKASGTETEAVWVMRTTPEAPTLQHDDEIRTDADRWRVIHVRAIADGQLAMLTNIQ